MTLLEQHFDMALETPGGIQKLREFILTLAMQGKLVPQDPNDPPARELIEEIKAEKKRLIKKGKIKKQKPLPPIKKGEVPYELPDGWEWCRFSDVIELRHGHQFRKHDFVPSGIPVIKIGQCKSNGRLDLRACDYIDESRKKEFEENRIYIDDVLMALTGGTLGKVTRVDKNYGVVVQNYRVGKFISIGNFFRKGFCTFILKSNLFQNLVKKSTNQNAQPNIGKEKIEALTIPTPPLNEQKRIVKKIDQLMALCDKLETERDERNKKRLKIQTGIMDSLLSASNTEDFNQSWEFITRHFDDIYSVPENVEDLKKAILQLAIMGKLVPQDPTDPSASDLLKKIKAEKEKLIKEGKIKNLKSFPPIKKDEIPFELPDGWAWCYLDDVIELISGQHIIANDYNEDQRGVPYLTGPSDFGIMNPVFTRWTSKPKVFAQIDDILITVKGSGVGKLNVLNIDKATIGRQLMAIRSDHLNRNYLYCFLKSNKEYFQKLKTGIAIPGISRKDILLKKFPLPPLYEQKRIIKKIDHLIQLCDSLEQNLKDSTTKQTSILDAVLAEL